MTGDQLERPAPAADGEDLDDAPGLFAAAVRPGAFDPYPVVTISGQDVASGPGAGLGPMVVDGLTITWGRADPLDQPEPATGTLQLFDPSRVWAIALDRRGQPVTLAWEHPSWPRTTFFRGRIGAPIQVVAKTVTLPDGTRVRGSLVTLPLVSILVDLANRFPTEDWPAETLGARRARVEAAAAGVLTSVTTRPHWHTPQVAPVPASEQVSVYEHLLALYDSSGGDRMTYSPATQATTYLPRRDYPTQRGHGVLWWDQSADATARRLQGVYVRAFAAEPAFSLYGTYRGLDSAHLAYDPSDGVTQPARITRVQLTHPDAGNAFEDRTVTLMVDGTNEVLEGVRALRLESIVAWNAWADTGASDLEEFVQKEGAAWRLEPVTFSSRRAGGFDSLAIAQFLLLGYEINDLVFLQRSGLPELNIRPVFGVMGQTITYRDRGWEVEMNLAPLTAASRVHPITWEEFDDGSATYEVQWWDGDHSRGLHPSLTYEDLGFVSRGLNVGTTPPDQGWDFYPS